ncbi:MAG: hypothetical protein ACRDHX_08520, partial [Chloroflexota bacterium]
ARESLALPSLILLSDRTLQRPCYFRSTVISVEVHRSARRHGVDDADMEHVVTNALAALDEDNDEGVNQVLYLGFNRPGDTLLEVVVLHFDDGRDMAIHAMRIQPQYEQYLPRGDDNA